MDLAIDWIHEILGYNGNALRISRPTVWSSCQSSWLQIERPWFNSRRYQIFGEVVGLEWGSLSLVSTIVFIYNFNRQS
jgi:hypothetical protein